MWTWIILALSKWLWPVVVLIIILLFQKKLNQFLESFSKGPVNIKFDKYSIELGSNNIPLPTNQIQQETIPFEYSRRYQSKLVTMEEKTIRSQITDSQMSSLQAIDILIYQLANAHLSNSLLTINQLIFPEQISLLTWLNKQFQPSSRSDLLKYYRDWKETTAGKDSTYSDDGFINFLVQQTLIIESMRGYLIGPLGVEYLKFLVDKKV